MISVDATPTEEAPGIPREDAPGMPREEAMLLLEMSLYKFVSAMSITSRVPVPDTICCRGACRIANWMGGWAKCAPMTMMLLGMPTPLESSMVPL